MHLSLGVEYDLVLRGRSPGILREDGYVHLSPVLRVGPVDQSPPTDFLSEVTERVAL